MRTKQTTFGQLIQNGLLEIGDGYRAKNEELTGDGEIFLRAGNVSDESVDFSNVERFGSHLTPRLATKMSKPGDTIVTTKGNSTGRTSFVTQRMPRFVYSPHLCYWRSRNHDELDNGFLRYWARSAEFQTQLSALKTSTDMAPYLSLTDQKKLRITLPSIEDQRRVGSILGSLDDKIELNRRMNATLESMAQAIFKSWFIDFDPVHRNVESREGGPKCKSSIAAITTAFADLFPDSFETSELGNIPAGWRIGRLSEVCARITSGGTPSTSNKAYWSGYLPWLSSGETGQRFIVGTEKHISESAAEESSTRLVRSGATVIAGAGQGKTRGQTSLLFIDTYINQSVIALEPDAARTSEAFLFFDMQRRYEQFRQLSDAHSSRGSLTTKLLADLAVVVPPPNIVTAFQGTVAPILDMIKNNLRENIQLINSRDTLLPALMRHDSANGAIA